MTNTASSNVKNVTIQAMAVHNLMTKVPQSNGDQAGALGGVVSSMIMGPCKHQMGSMKVMFSGSPATKMSGVTGQNGSSPNGPGTTTTPSQSKVSINS
jgi:hypothetical protein